MEFYFGVTFGTLRLSHSPKQDLFPSSVGPKPLLRNSDFVLKDLEKPPKPEKLAGLVSGSLHFSNQTAILFLAIRLLGTNMTLRGGESPVFTE